MHTTRSAACVLSIVSFCTAAFAQSLQYQVQTYAPFPQLASAGSQYIWQPRGLLPDNSIVTNVRSFHPEQPALVQDSAMILSSEGWTGFSSPTGASLDRPFVMGVEPSGRVHISSENVSFDDRFFTWQNGVAVPQSQSLGISPFGVSDISSAGHILGEVYGDTSSASEVIFNGTRRVIQSQPTGIFDDRMYRVNSSGDVAGFKYFQSEFVAYVWSTNGDRVLSFPAIEPQQNLRIYTGFDMNDLGWVVAMRTLNDQITITSKTYLWRGDERIELPGGGGDAFSNAQLDNLGTVLSADSNGQYLWRDGTLTRMTDLNLSGFTGTLLSIDRLEPDGRAIGQALVDGIRVPVVLTPIPAPSSVALVLAGVTIAAARRRRNGIS